MRIYIIGNDGITLCREAPASVTDGEIAVASQEELHAASLSGRRLCAAAHSTAPIYSHYRGPHREWPVALKSEPVGKPQ